MYLYLVQPYITLVPLYHSTLIPLHRNMTISVSLRSLTLQEWQIANVLYLKCLLFCCGRLYVVRSRFHQPMYKHKPYHCHLMIIVFPNFGPVWSSWVQWIHPVAVDYQVMIFNELTAWLATEHATCIKCCSPRRIPFQYQYINTVNILVSSSYQIQSFSCSWHYMRMIMLFLLSCIATFPPSYQLDKNPPPPPSPI